MVPRSPVLHARASTCLPRRPAPPAVALALAALAIAMLLPPGARAAGPAGEWSLIPGDPPAPRAFPAAIYDPAGDRMVTFGGQPVCDTWSLTFSGVDPGWRRHSNGSLPPRYGHSAIYDPLRGRMIVFGGVDSIGGGSFNDVWVRSLSGAEGWSPLATYGTPPAGRAWHSAAYDPVRDRMIVFGGRLGSYKGGGGTSTDQVWTLSLGATPTWTALAPSGITPLTRDRATMVYDSNRDRLLIYGGWDQPASAWLNDTWALTLGASPEWVRLDVSGAGPGPRRDGLAVYDAPHDRLVFFGGDNGTPQNDTWELDLGLAVPTWAAIASPVLPPARNAGSVVLDAVRRRMVVFGGPGGTPRNDVWALPLDGAPVWTDLSPTAVAPAPRAQFSGVYDAAGQRMLVFGGYTGKIPGTYLNDTWALSLGSFPSWSPVTTLGAPPPPRMSHSAIEDPVRRNMVIFGGDGAGGAWHNDTWILSLGSSTWSQAVTGGQLPIARNSHSAVYDGSRDRMVIFGGYRVYDPLRPNLPLFLNDAWELSLSSLIWKVIYVGASTPPLQRIDAAAMYDPIRDRMIVFGGMSEHGTPLNDVWALDFGPTVNPWQQLTPLGTPPAGRRGAYAVYDALRDRMVVFGGSNYQLLLDEVWELSFQGTPTWTRLFPDGAAPMPRDLGASVYDAGSDRMVLAGGWISNDLSGIVNDGAILAWASPTAVAISLVSAEIAGGAVHLAWSVDAGTPLAVERRTESSAWTAIGSPARQPDGRWSFEDRGAPDGRCGYRLEVLTATGTEVGGETWVEVAPAPARLAITAPNPIAGAARVTLALPAAGAARLEVLDAAGRRVAAREIEARAPGEQVLLLPELTSGRPGICWLRLIQGGRSVTRRVVVLR